MTSQTPTLLEEIQRALGTRYTLTEPYKTLGNGAYGIVVEAQCTSTRNKVAVKRMTRVFEDLVDCKRILREVAILNRIRHRSVVELLDIIIPEPLDSFEEILLILEIADTDFKKLFLLPAYLSNLHIKTLMYNCLVGLNYIHSAGIYHRDLKPANILANKNCQVKICDFGLARAVSQNTSRTPEVFDCTEQPESASNATSEAFHNLRGTQLTAHVVTRWYRAPELILLQRDYSQAIDMWSMGCIFGELLQTLSGNRRVEQRHALFPGQHSFPLSPAKRPPPRRSEAAAAGYAERDQLAVVLRIIGAPTEEDLAELNEDARRYTSLTINKFSRDNPFPSSQNVVERLRADFPSPTTTDAAIDLLARMLRFNPAERITVQDALNHEYFSEPDQLSEPCQQNLRFTRNERSEEPATETVVLPFDDGAAMEENALRYYLIKEMQRLNPDVVMPRSLSAFETSSGA